MTLTQPVPIPRVSGHRQCPEEIGAADVADQIVQVANRIPLPPAPDFPIYRKGARVTHLDHGRGTVVETNTTASVSVEFDKLSGATWAVDWHYVTKIGVPQPVETAQ